MRAFLILPIIALSALSCGFGAGDDARIASVIIDPGVTPIALRNMDDSGRAIGSIGRLKALVESRGRRLHFAMNGGMYMEDQRPLGLYVEDGRTVRKLVTRTDGYGNFYLNPNGVFGVDSTGKAFVVTTAEYPSLRGVRQATQSGPMLVVDGQEHVPLPVGGQVTVRRAPVTFRLARVAGRGYYSTLRDKLHWGAQPNYRSEPPSRDERTQE